MFKLREGRARILIVDDEAPIRAILAMFLGGDYDCVCCANGEEAIAYLAEGGKIDLVITDINMGPGMSGLQMLPRLMELAPDAVAIVASGVSTGESAIEALRAGVFDYLIKPFELMQVSATVARALDYHDLRLTKKLYEKHLEELVEQRTAELQHQAYHDPLTGLPNRALLEDRLAQSFTRAKRQAGSVFAVLFIDVDRFKVVNDSLGHLVGDQLLIEVANKLKQGLRSCDTVARMGGDEFTIILENVEGLNNAVKVTERLIELFAAPLIVSGREIYTTLSVGIAIYTPACQSPGDLMRDADIAMHRAKDRGKDRYEVYDQEMHTKAVALLQLENDLRLAIERQEFVVHYQPIIELATHRLCGFESLIRWQHPVKGLVYPDQFIFIAEDTGLIAAIGRLALEESCRQLRRWQKEYPQARDLFMSVNVSLKQFKQENILEQISAALAENRLDPSLLKLEITETVLMDNTRRAAEVLGALKSLGVSIVTDDFGTGYSSLSLLHEFPIDTLKVDRSFISQMSESEDSLEIVKAVIAMARSLKMNIVAEGIETVDQLVKLQELNCPLGQGYLFSRPVGHAAAEQMLTAPTLAPEHLLALT